MRKARLFLISTLVELLVLTGSLLLLRAGIGASDRAQQAARAELARELGLTDLAIWTEARYTRHPSQADFFSAFQDTPGGLEHFPAGSVVSPPASSALPEELARADAGE